MAERFFILTGGMLAWGLFCMWIGYKVGRSDGRAGNQGETK